MNKYILVLALVAAIGAIVSHQDPLGPMNPDDVPVAPVAGEYDHEDEVLTEEEDRALSERADDEEGDEDNYEEANGAARRSLSLKERFDRVVNSLTKSDEVETAELRKTPEDFEKHEKFCYKVRDDVNAWVADAINSKVSWAMQIVGKLFFDTATVFGAEGNKAVAQGSEMVKEDARRFVESMQLILNVVRETILGHRERTIEDFKNGVNMDSFSELMSDACTQVQKKKREIDREFGDRSWTKLGCVTVKRVKVTERLCSVFLALSPFFKEFTD